MKLLNLQYRGIKKVTDVISFPQKTNSSRDDFNILGDIVVCIPEVFNRSKDNVISFYDELLMILLHGLLHLVGYDHETNTYQKRKMEKKEREIFNALKAMA
jgi:rRNA maturation RNase YbeY